VQPETKQGWLTQRRLTRAAQLAFAVFLLFWLVWFARFLDTGSPDSQAPKVDYIAYWAAAKLTRDGDATLAYDDAVVKQTQTDEIGSSVDGLPWLYPPFALLIFLPLALLPYAASFAAWLAVSGAIMVSATRRITRAPWGVWLALAFPATAFNLISGQAGMLSAGLFAWGMLLLPKRPVLAGAVLGMMAFKPHFVPLILLALFAGRQKQALLSTIGSVTALSLASLALFGTEPWHAFLSDLPHTTDLLFSGVFPVQKMQSVSAMAISLGLGSAPTQALQAVTTIGAIGFVFWLWRRDTAFEYKVAGLGLAALLATPYVYHHDLTVMGVAMLYFSMRAREYGWQRWEREAVAVAFFLPLASFVLGTVTGVTVGAVVLLALTAVIIRRIRYEEAMTQSATRAELTAA
jgi:Glycosyltransferase family 87